MSETNFPDFIRRVRAGDEQAARELVERYEPVIRREVRMRLRDPRLSSQVEWTDICQSVMASFFVRAASGQYDLEQPEHLLRLLVVMTRHKLSNQRRRNQADRRDYRRLEACTPEFLDGRSQEAPTPSRMVAGRELLEEFRSGYRMRSARSPTSAVRAASGLRLPPSWVEHPKRGASN